MCGVDIDSDSVDINSEQLSLLLDADNILIAQTEHSLQGMLDTLNDWCQKWRLLVYRDKTKVLHFRPCGKDESQGFS